MRFSPPISASLLLGFVVGMFPGQSPAEAAILVAVGRLGAIIQSPDSGTTWSLRETGTVAQFNDVAGIGEHFWAVGSDGAIFHSSDFGLTWFPQISGTTAWLSGVDFVDTNIGWAVGGQGTILRTTNGGATWEIQEEGNDYLLAAVSATSSDEAWVGGFDGTIKHTSNGGENWEFQDSGTLYNLYDIEAVSATSIHYVTSVYNVVGKSVDGGATWDTQLLQDNKAGRDIDFITPSKGYLVELFGRVFVTEDSGATWTYLSTTPTDRNESMMMLNELQGWTVSGDRFSRTLDGGLTWFAEDVIWNRSLLNMAAVDSPIFGDFDGDGVVGGADFMAWQRGASPNPWSDSDLAEWQSQYGTIASVAPSVPIPEPSTLVLLAVGLALAVGNESK